MNSRRLFISASIAVTLLAYAPASSGQVSDWNQIQPPPLHAFRPQLPKRIQLANGMVIFLEEDHELPLIRGTAQIRGGSRDEPADLGGEAKLCIVFPILRQVGPVVQFQLHFLLVFLGRCTGIRCLLCYSAGGKNQGS